MPKIIKVGGNLTKLRQNNFAIFCDMVCIQKIKLFFHMHFVFCRFFIVYILANMFCVLPRFLVLIGTCIVCLTGSTGSTGATGSTGDKRRTTITTKTMNLCDGPVGNII